MFIADTFMLGQLRLPPKKVCDLLFIRDILSGKKSALRRCEINSITVPKIRHITVQVVLDHIKDVKEICKYLPDLENITPKQIDR